MNIFFQTLYLEVQSRRRAFDNYNDLSLPSIHQLFYAAYIVYSSYANPANLQSCSIDCVIDYLKTNRNWQDQLPDKLLVWSISRWKVGFIRGFLNFPRIQIFFNFKTFGGSFSISRKAFFLV